MNDKDLGFDIRNNIIDTMYIAMSLHCAKYKDYYDENGISIKSERLVSNNRPYALQIIVTVGDKTESKVFEEEFFNLENCTDLFYQEMHNMIAKCKGYEK